MSTALERSIASRQAAIIRQARRVVIMRRKNTLWRDLEPELNKLNQIVKALESLEKKQGEKKPKAMTA